jgi:hypothetical protein
MTVRYWERLQLDSSDPTFAQAHQVQVRDPLWFLARQWQVGELTGFDGGSPIDAAYQLHQSNVTAYCPWTDAKATGGSRPGMASQVTETTAPLEVRVESETVALGLRGSTQLGLRFESILRAKVAAGSDIAVVLQWFRDKFPIASAPSPNEMPDTKAGPLRRLSAGRLTDGWRLYQAMIAQPPAQISPDAQAAVDSFVKYCAALYSEPSGTSAWSPTASSYRFSAAVETKSPPAAVGLYAQKFRGGSLDWYSFDYSAAAQGSGLRRAVERTNAALIPQRLSVPGMPTTKWWEFEDGNTNLGDLDTQVTDLTKMLLAEFAAVATNDWFQFSIPVKLGTLNRLEALVVTDSFGVRTLIHPTGSDAVATSKPWQMFTLDGDPGRRDTLFLPPTLSRVIDGPPLEQVILFRDDMAAMGWAVENLLPGPLDTSTPGEQPLTIVPAATPPSGADVNYLVGNTVPRNWIPLVPFTAADGTLLLRRGTMIDPSQAEERFSARGTILTGRMFLLLDQALPRSGINIERYFRRTRWIDGSLHCWLARRTTAGRGEVYSGLAFDVLENVPTSAAPPAPAPIVGSAAAQVYDADPERK